MTVEMVLCKSSGATPSCTEMTLLTWLSPPVIEAVPSSTEPAPASPPLDDFGAAEGMAVSSAFLITIVFCLDFKKSTGGGGGGGTAGPTATGGGGTDAPPVTGGSCRTDRSPASASEAAAEVETFALGDRPAAKEDTDEPSSPPTLNITLRTISLASLDETLFNEEVSPSNRSSPVSHSSPGELIALSLKNSE